MIHKKFKFSKLLPKTGKKTSIPGDVDYVGKKREEPVVINLLDYDEANYTEKKIGNIKDCLPHKKSSTVTWINVSGVHNTKIIEDVGKYFNIHPLVLEDIANTTKRPKVEEYDDYLFIILKMVYFNQETKDINVEQVSILIGKNYVISFEERHGDILEPLLNRIRNNKGRIRRLNSDYLCYSIIDTIIDHYFTILESIGEQIEDLEDNLIDNPEKKTLNSIYKLKQELVYLRKSIWPTREVVSWLQRTEHKLIDESVFIYLRDVYDHTVQVVETVETFRDLASGMLDLYLSTVSNKMNEVMKVLTIFAAIFIPLTFIAGVYGMNFDYFPELHWKFGYFGALGIMTLVVIIMIIFFKKKKWM